MKLWSQSAFGELRALSAPPPMKYSCDLTAFPQWLRDIFVTLERDEETEEFLEECEQVGLVAYVTTIILRQFWSVTDVNGFVGAGQMFVFSSAQARQLLRAPQVNYLGCFDSLLDIGAGDGNVTKKLAPLFKEVVTTELSLPMVRRLRAHGYTSLHTGDLTTQGLQGHGSFSVISLLNVLDRCDKPKTMLRQIKELLDPNGGVLLIAVVLPFLPFVESGTEKLPPTERLGISPQAKFDAAAVELAERVFLPAGFTVRSVSRVPYISHSFSNSSFPYCTLDDALFVLAPNKEVLV